MDRSLDEILAERQSKRGGPKNTNTRGGGAGGRRRERQDYPRDGVRKSFRDEPRNLDTEWVHDRFDDSGDRRPAAASRRRYSPDKQVESRGSKVRVDNIHYELTEEDLEGLFSKIGPVVKLELRYDRAGRSEGTAYVTYESNQDAAKAVREYDGANAAGQPIRLTILPSGPAPRRNPFDTAVMPGRPLAERITVPSGRSRSLSPAPNMDDDEAARRGIDRYRPGGKNISRSRSPLPPRRREGGCRPGARRDGPARGNDRGPRPGREGRQKKTQEELDAEMEDYFGGGGESQPAAATANGSAAAAAAAAAAGGNQTIEDIDMIE